MNEKRFYHTALENDLLSGQKQKRRIDAALGRTSAETAATVRTTASRAASAPRWFVIPATAVMLMLTLAVGAVVLSSGMRGTHQAAVQPHTSNAPSAEKQLISEDRAEIKLLPELDPEHRFDQTRINALGLPAYDEAEWGWLREATATATDLSATADSIRWTIELRVPKGAHTENPFEALVDVTRGMPLCFFHADSGLDTPDEGAQLVEFASPGEITFSETADEWIAYIPEICAMPQIYDRFPSVLPPTGEVKITNTLLLLERAGENAGEIYVATYAEDEETGERTYPIAGSEMLPAALLGTVEHTFVFDAEALLNVAELIHIDLPLSGEYILSIHEGNGFHNERVSLDGVTLDAEIHYTAEGIWVILSIKNAGSLSEAEQEALYIALSGGPDGSFAEGDAKTKAGAPVRVFRMTRAFWGSVRCGRYYLAIDPAAFGKAKTILFWPEAAYVIGAVGEEPDENWSWNSGDGTLPSLMYESKQLGCIEIPLPTIEETTALQPTPEPADGMLEIYVYFRDDNAEEAITAQFKAQYPELYNAYMYTDWTDAPQVQVATEAKRKIAAEYYTAKNRERCLALCGEEDIVFLSNYAAMAIIRVPETAIGELRSKPFVTFIQPFEEKTASTSAAAVTCSAALTEQLNKADAQTRLMVSIGSIAFGNELESAFRYQGKSLPEWRNQPALAARSEEYEIWYHTIYPGIDEQNRNTPGWEKHDPNELFDTYWRERHTEAEIAAYEQANEAYLTARNAYFEWRDGEGGKEALRKLWQQECDRLNGLGLSLMLTKVSDTQYRLDGTTTVEVLRSFPAKDGYQYWISLQNDDSPIDE